MTLDIFLSSMAAVGLAAALITVMTRTGPSQSDDDVIAQRSRASGPSSDRHH